MVCLVHCALPLGIIASDSARIISSNPPQTIVRAVYSWLRKTGKQKRRPMRDGVWMA